VETGILPLGRLVEAMSLMPARRFGLGGGEITVGAPADLTAFDFGKEYRIDPREFLSMGSSTPFEGMKVKGRCLLTLANGDIVWKEEF
jgi:dihydroorotase